MKRRQRAFTLLEVLIALGIFAIMAILSYRALSAVLDSRDQLSAETAKWRDLSLFFARFEQDLDAVMNRPSRSADDIKQDAFALNPDSTAEAMLAFTRSGYAQADGGLAAPQRVGYRLQTRTQNGASGDRKIELLLWPHLDMPPRAGARTYPTLSNVADFKVRVLDAQGNWQTRWPILTAGGAAPVAIPNGLEVAVTLSSGETVTRMFAMRGSSS